MMAKMLTLFVMIWLMTCSYCSPVKRSTSGQQATDCYGTECEVDLDFPPQTVDVHFPENLSQTILTVLPNIEVTQNKTVALLENMMTTFVTAIQRHDQQMQNMTSSMTDLFGNVANLLQSQLGVLRERLPSPPSSPSTSPSTSPSSSAAAAAASQLPLSGRDCQDIAAQGGYLSGPYTIAPPDDLGSFTVYCDMDTDGGGWTVFQRRFSGSVDFYRGWDAYEQGFGNPNGEYWAGLRQIRRLTKNGNWVLRIDMEDFDGNTAYAEYESFSVGDAGLNYILAIGTYSGTAGDSLARNNNNAFSTKERDHDDWPDNCAVYHHGAWWYSSGCGYSNLNGQYTGSSQSYGEGMFWWHWKGDTEVLKRSEMKMRHIQ